MLTVKFEKREPTANGEGPDSVPAYAVFEARSVWVTRREQSPTRERHSEVQIGAAPQDTFTLCVGFDEVYKVAFVMNEAGKTVDVIR